MRMKEKVKGKKVMINHKGKNRKYIVNEFYNEK